MNDKITKIKELGRRQGGNAQSLKRKKRTSFHTLFSDLHMHGVTCVHTETNKDNNLKVTKNVLPIEVTEMDRFISLTLGCM